MSRPKPKITLEHIDDEQFKTEVILADSVWVVCYRGAPIALRRGLANTNYPGPKYLKSAWPNPGHAFNRAERLNAMFNTTDFTVWEMRPARQVAEPTPVPRELLEYNRTWEPTKFSAEDIVPKPGPRPKQL